MAANDKTVYEGNDTVYENDSATVYEDSGATVYEGSIAEAAIAEAAKHSGESLQNSDIVKGSTLMDTYTVESSAINGGMGSVWRVHHNGWNVDLAMKRPKPAFFATSETKERFIKECRVWSDLGLHPNIVSCYYVRDIGGTPSIFSEWMENGSLGDRIADERLYQGSEAEQHKRLLDIAIQFARGLHYAHEQGLIHQDVKPDNLMLTSGWDAKVSDFGIANARTQLTVLEVEVPDGGTIVSASGARSPHYCSMEQMDGKTLTRRTDIYSWAVSVLEMYLGCKPWAGANYDTGPMAGLNCREYFEQARIPMPQRLKELLAKCLASEPENRPHDFGIVEEELREIYQQLTETQYPRPVPKASADTPDSLNNYGLSNFDLGDEAKAEWMWNRALEIDLYHMMARYNSGLVMMRQGKLSVPFICAELRHTGRQTEQQDVAEELIQLLEREEQSDTFRAPFQLSRFQRIEDMHTREEQIEKMRAGIAEAVRAEDISRALHFLERLKDLCGRQHPERFEQEEREIVRYCRTVSLNGTYVIMRKYVPEGYDSGNIWKPIPGYIKLPPELKEDLEKNMEDSSIDGSIAYFTTIHFYLLILDAINGKVIYQEPVPEGGYIGVHSHDYLVPYMEHGKNLMLSQHSRIDESGHIIAERDHLLRNSNRPERDELPNWRRHLGRYAMRTMGFTRDGRYHQDQRTYYDFSYEFPGWTDWDDEALPYLKGFLLLHPRWTDKHFETLIENLQYSDFGYIRPDGVRAKLEELAPGSYIKELPQNENFLTRLFNRKNRRR